MARIEFKRLDILSVGKICAAISAVIGFFAGLIFAAGIGAIAAWTTVPGLPIPVSIGLVTGGFAVAAIVIFPIFAAIWGFLCGSIGAFLYNIIAQRIGGIVVETK